MRILLRLHTFSNGRENALDILIVGLNYAPEPIGIGPYTAGLAESLAAAGHRVTVVAGNPYYPDWKLAAGFENQVSIANESGVRVIRVPHYIPARPSGARRIAHHLSFARSALRPALAEVRRSRPHCVLTVAPSLLAAPVALAAARKAGAPSWLHIQDFEVEAAVATGLLSAGPLAGLASLVERKIICRFDRVSSISAPMLAKAVEKGADPATTLELRNWAESDGIGGATSGEAIRQELDLPSGKVALYSGNLALKQGVGLIAEAARLLSHRADIQFVVCGEGSGRSMLEDQAEDLDNLHMRPLMPRDRLGELLAMADVHLLPQIANAADLVLPSKLTNMLASGRPVVATADTGTALAGEVEGCGLVTPPGDSTGFAGAVEQLMDADHDRQKMGAAAEIRAQERWSRKELTARFVTELEALARKGKA